MKLFVTLTKIKGYPEWSLETHRKYPMDFKRAVLTVLLIAGYDPIEKTPSRPECMLHLLPREILFLLLQYMAPSRLSLSLSLSLSLMYLISILNCFQRGLEYSLVMVQSNAWLLRVPSMVREDIHMESILQVSLYSLSSLSLSLLSLVSLSLALLPNTLLQQ